MKNTDVRFWDLLEEFSITIPSIQRDYVQGSRAKQVIAARTTLLDDLAAACKSGKPMNLNFIYGEVQDSGQNRVFLPLDGQQRLTTLFLLHWYATVWSKDSAATETEALLGMLGKFSYETRVTSTEFFKRITDIEKVNTLDPSGAPSSQIRNKSWFRPQWEFDPTVKSALLMLDEIHLRFAEVPGLLATLVSQKSPIRFEWLDIDGIGNASDLYIKMNSRGKVLSEFDNFKAELESKFPEEAGEQLRQRFFTKVDQAWTDYFWKMGATADPEDYGTRFMNVLHALLFNQWCVLDSDFDDTSQWPAPVRNLAERSTGRTLADYTLGLDEDGLDQLLNQKWFERVEKTLDYVVSEDCVPEVREVVETIAATSPNKLRNRDRFLLRVISSYFGTRRTVQDFEGWNDWYRTFKHISNHANTYQGYNAFTQYREAIRQVTTLETRADSILDHLAHTAVPMRGFAPEQITEEQLKAKLRTQDPAWGELINNAESLNYFQGKISFLLEFSETIDGTELSKTAFEEKTKLAFANYLETASDIFGRNGLAEDPATANLLRSALLTKGDYTLPVGSLRTYVVHDSRDRDWRMLLRPRPGEFKNSRIMFKHLLDDLVNRSGTVEERLTELLSEYEWNPEREDIWNAYLILDPGLFAALEERSTLLQVGPRRVGNAIIAAVPLQTNKTLHGYNSELHLEMLGVFLAEEGMDVELFFQKGLNQENLPYLLVRHQNRNLHVGIDVDATLEEGKPLVGPLIVSRVDTKKHEDVDTSIELFKGNLAQVWDYIVPEE